MKNLIFFLLLFLLIGCSESGIDDEKFWINVESAPSAEISEGNLPVWLVDTINEYENSKEMGIYAISPVRLYKGEWKRRTVYWIRDPLSSCIFCHTYYEDGTKIVFTDDESNSLSFQNDSKNWVLVWKIGGTI